MTLASNPWKGGFRRAVILGAAMFMSLFQKKKTYAVRRPKRRTRREFDPKSAVRFGQFVLAAVVIYTLASLLALGTGPLGHNLSSRLVSFFGGGIVLPLLHLLYLLVCLAVGRRADGGLRQWLGTIFSYLAITLLLTFLYRDGLGRQMALLSPGTVGSGMLVFFKSSIGVFGAMLSGLLLVAAAFFQYGHLSTDRVNWLRSTCSRLSWRRLRDLLEDKGAESVSLERPSVPLEILETPDDDGEAGPPEDRSEEKQSENAFPLEAAPDPIPQVPRPARRGLFASLFHGSEKADVEAITRAMRSGEERDQTSSSRESDMPHHEFSRTRRFTVERLPGMENTEPVANDEPSLPFTLVPATEPTRHGLAVEVGRDIMSSTGKSWTTNLFGFKNATPPSVTEIPEHTDFSRLQTDDLHKSAVPAPPFVVVDGDTPVIGVETAELERQIPEGAFPPPLDLLGPSVPGVSASENTAAKGQGEDVIEALASFGVSATLAHSIVGPTVIQYQIQLAPGIKVSKVSALEADIAVALAVPSIRVEAPVPGTTYVGVELPNPRRRAVALRTVLESEAFQKARLNLPLPLGQTVDGRILISGLEELPHLLVAGTTGSGKSIFINNCITALCYHNTPTDLRFIMVDPKRVEMSFYEHLPHILSKPIATPQAAVHALGWAVREMEDRYETFSTAKARNLASYNAKVLPKDRLPHIVIIVDELADLMMTAPKEVEEYIARLAQMARATGIHLILATQRPSVNVITGTIKANIPARVAFSLPSVADSRTILDVSGAQHLLGRGDMLFVSTRHPRPLRIQSPFMDEATNIRVVEYLRGVFGEPEYVELEDQENGRSENAGSASFLDDPRLMEAVSIVMGTGIASSSRLQRQMRVGFTRAARLIDSMEQLGIVGPADGAKPREILVDEDQVDEILTRHGVH